MWRRIKSRSTFLPFTSPPPSPISLYHFLLFFVMQLLPTRMDMATAISILFARTALPPNAAQQQMNLYDTI